MENIQQNINSNLIINNEDIDIELKALPFTFYHDETPKLKYNNRVVGVMKREYNSSAARLVERVAVEVRNTQTVILLIQIYRCSRARHCS